MAGSPLMVICLCAVVQLSLVCCSREEKYRQRTSIYICNEQLSKQYCKDPCSTPQNVDLFDKNFTKAVENCDLLSSLFDGMKRVTREEFHAGSVYISTVYRTQKGFENPTEDANKANRAVTINCDKLAPNLVRSILSNSAAKMLNENYKLTSKNAAELANQLAASMKNVANNIASKNCPRSQVESVTVGWFNFLNGQKIFEPDTMAPTTVIYPNEWICEDKNTSAPQKNCPITNYSPRKTFLRQSDDVCNMRSKAIDIFVSTFRNEVRRCKVLTNLFNVRPDVSPQEMSRGTYYVSLFFLSDNGVENPRELADFMSRFIKDVKPLSISQLEGVHARFIAKYLESGKLLDAKNAKSQALKLADAMKKRAELVVDNRWPTSKVAAIQLGWRYFLDLDQLLTKETAPRMAYLYGNEWRCEAKSSV